MAFTAKDVQKLREMTGVGMMDCKKALEASDGDMDKAIEWLREKGLAASQKKASRIAADGMAYAEVFGNVGVIVEVNSETDFVAKNEKFINFVKGIAETIAKVNPKDLDALMEAQYLDTDKTVAQQQQEMVLVIGENIKVRRFARFDEGVSVAYVHMGGKIAVLVNLGVSSGLEDKVVELGKDIAMQIAALNPTYLDKSNVEEATLKKEKEILTVQAKNDPKNANKPDNIIEKMVMGRLSKFFKDNCLMQQDFVKDDSVTVEQHIASVAKELGGTITLNKFVRFEKGEGIEKKADNFADEVANMIK